MAIMLQRKQTLWMLCAAACAVLTIKLPFSTGMNTLNDKMIYPVNATSGWPLLFLTVLVAVGSLVNIFNYKNRTLQLRATIVLILVSLVNIFFLYQKTITLLGSTYSLSSILALAIPVFLIFAVRGIARDQKLVRSADRLR